MLMLSEIVEKWGGEPEGPMGLYADVFKLGDGCIQREGEPPGEFKANPLIIGHSGGEGGRMHRKILFEDTFADTLAEFQGMDWAFMSPCSYFGRSNSAERQSKLFAFVFDIDGVEDSNLNNFFSGAFVGGAYPIPQHVVLSGHGVHLYYVLEEPLDLYPNIKTQAKEMKYALTRRMWNRYTSTVEDVQYQGINQSFRIPGSNTKADAPIRKVEAYRLNPHPATIEELNGFVPEESRVDAANRYRASKMTAAEAKEKYPDWYSRVVEGGGGRGQWNAKRDLYEWWLRKVEAEATYGHRYFCIMALAIYAAKCGIYDYDEVEEAALALVPYLDSLNPDCPFTEEDVRSALECLDARYVTFPRHDIAKLTDIDIPANKRNGRKQEVHLARARIVQEFDDPDGDWRNKKGAPKKCNLIREYALAHPGENHSEIARALGVSRPTVIKWLKPGWEEEYADLVDRRNEEEAFQRWNAETDDYSDAHFAAIIANRYDEWFEARAGGVSATVEWARRELPGLFGRLQDARRSGTEVTSDLIDEWRVEFTPQQPNGVD